MHVRTHVPVEKQADELAIKRVQEAEPQAQRERGDPRHGGGAACEPQPRAAGGRQRRSQAELHEAVRRKRVRKRPGNEKRRNHAHDARQMPRARRHVKPARARQKRRRAQHDEQPRVACNGAHQPHQHPRIDQNPVLRRLPALRRIGGAGRSRRSRCTLIEFQRFSTPLKTEPSKPHPVRVLQGFGKPPSARVLCLSPLAPYVRGGAATQICLWKKVINWPALHCIALQPPEMRRTA